MSGAANFCAKTNFIAAAPSKTNICSAYSAIKIAFAKALPLATDALSRANLFGAAVRLPFHDAGEINIGIASDKMGPDGCLAPGSDSAGLIEPTCIVNTVLEPIWQSVCDKISRADFWALFGKIVLETAASAPIKINYQYGRKDSVNCVAGAGRLPSAQGNYTEVNQVFVNQMGLTLSDAGKMLELDALCSMVDVTEYCMQCALNYVYVTFCVYVVTLLGAHSLGHVHIANSGYGFVDPTAEPNQLSAWDDTPHILDNGYFVNLAGEVS